MGVEFLDNGGIRIPGVVRHANNFQPPIDLGQIAQRNLQEYPIDLASCLLHQRVANAAGIGITGAAASFTTSVEKIGSIIKTTIIIDLAGLNSGGVADDVIGDDGSGVAHLGQITAAVNGTIISGKLTCLETPATGDDDIDVYSATENTGVEDTAIGDLTETALCNSGDLVAGTEVALAAPAADQFLYLVGGTGGDATYSAGILKLEFWGKDATDDLSVVGGTLGTNAPSLQTEDLRDVGVTWRYRRYAVILPPEYVAGETVLIRVKGGMITTVADTTAFADVNCYENEEDNSVSADLCTTAETTINALIATATTVDFTITAATLSPGSVLDVRVGVEVTDASTGAEVIGCITKISLLCDTQG